MRCRSQANKPFTFLFIVVILGYFLLVALLPPSCAPTKRTSDKPGVYWASVKKYETFSLLSVEITLS